MIVVYSVYFVLPFILYSSFVALGQTFEVYVVVLFLTSSRNMCMQNPPQVFRLTHMRTSKHDLLDALHRTYVIVLHVLLICSQYDRSSL